MAGDIGLSLFVSFTEAIAWAKAREVILPDEYYGNRIGIARAEAFSVAGLASLDQLELIKQSLDQATADGMNFHDWKKWVTDDEINLSLPNHRLDNIFRTNIQGAYMAGRWSQMQAVKEDRPYLMYDAINDSRTRPSHLAMDNIIKPIDDPFWKKHYPPNGYRCRCGVRSLSKEQAKKRGGITADDDIPDEAKADKGWDYNVGLSRGEGIRRAIEQKLERCKQLGFSVDFRNCNPAIIDMFHALKKRMDVVGNEVRIATEKEAQSFINHIYTGIKKTDKKDRSWLRHYPNQIAIGRMNTVVLSFVAQHHESLSSDIVYLPRDRIVHSIRDEKAGELTLEQMLLVPSIVAGDNIYFDHVEKRVMYVLFVGDIVIKVPVAVPYKKTELNEIRTMMYVPNISFDSGIISGQYEKI